MRGLPSLCMHSPRLCIPRAVISVISMQHFQPHSADVDIRIVVALTDASTLVMLPHANEVLLVPCTLGLLALHVIGHAQVFEGVVVALLCLLAYPGSQSCMQWSAQGQGGGSGCAVGRMVGCWVVGVLVGLIGSWAVQALYCNM